MKKFKGTKGEGKVDNILLPYVKEFLDDAKLIADAGTTINKCGLFPSELLKQRNELLEALQNLCESFDKYGLSKHQFQSYWNAKKAINKAI